VANINFRHPIATWSSLGALACAIVVMIFLDQNLVADQVGNCDGVHVNAGPSGSHAGPLCENFTSCQKVNECLADPWACPDGSCGPMGQECARAQYSMANQTGQCSDANYPNASCTTCDSYCCASGQICTFRNFL
jgi:hypothetical protein